MATHGSRLTRLRVRFLAPHPLLFALFAVFVLSSSAEAATVRDTLFGVGFYYDNATGLVTRVGGYSFANAGTYEKYLATELYDLALGIDANVLTASSLTTLEELTSTSNTYLASIEDYQKSIRLMLNTLETDLSDNFTSLESLLASQHEDTKTFWTAFFAEYKNVLTAYRGAGELTQLSVPDLLATIAYNQHFYDYYEGDYLASWGLDTNGDVTTAGLLANGFSGIATLIAGTSENGRKAVIEWISPSDGLTTTQYEFDSLFDILSFGFQSLQNPLAELRYVLADDNDIALKAATEENQQSFTDNFTGNGGGSVGTSDISNAAGVTSSAKDAFASDASPGDSFVAISDSNSYIFFSQPVSDALDTVSDSGDMSAFALDDGESEDDFMNGFVADDDGFYRPADNTPWDVYTFLGRD